MTITIELASRITRLRGGNDFAMGSVPPVMRPPRVKWERGEAVLLGDAEADIRAALDTPELAEALGRAVQSAIDRHRAKTHRARHALLDTIADPAAETVPDMEYHAAIGHLLDECGGEWRGVAADLARDLERYGQAMSPRSAAQRLWQERHASRGYIVYRQIRYGNSVYTIRKP